MKFQGLWLAKITIHYVHYKKTIGSIYLKYKRVTLVLSHCTIIQANGRPNKIPLQFVMRIHKDFGPTLAMRWHHDDLVTKCSENQLWKVLGRENSPWLWTSLLQIDRGVF